MKYTFQFHQISYIYIYVHAVELRLHKFIGSQIVYIIGVRVIE